ncbi:hypothetical protein, partial [Niabella hirudinis]|uniref:hypothetical protein n=1 Tax=Niabella hirudinis TaxID=1285929 RepID=UPI003EBE1C7D
RKGRSRVIGVKIFAPLAKNPAPLAVYFYRDVRKASAKDAAGLLGLRYLRPLRKTLRPSRFIFTAMYVKHPQRTQQGYWG